MHGRAFPGARASMLSVGPFGLGFPAQAVDSGHLLCAPQSFGGQLVALQPLRCCRRRLCLSLRSFWVPQQQDMRQTGGVRSHTLAEFFSSNRRKCDANVNEGVSLCEGVRKRGGVPTCAGVRGCAVRCVMSFQAGVFKHRLVPGRRRSAVFFWQKP